MKYTEYQAREALREHPWLAIEMKLTPKEFRILIHTGEYFTRKELIEFGIINKGKSSDTLKMLEKKGYIVRCGTNPLRFRKL